MRLEREWTCPCRLLLSLLYKLRPALPSPAQPRLCTGCFQRGRFSSPLSVAEAASLPLAASTSPEADLCWSLVPSASVPCVNAALHWASAPVLLLDLFCSFLLLEPASSSLPKTSSPSPTPLPLHPVLSTGCCRSTLPQRATKSGSSATATISLCSTSTARTWQSTAWLWCGQPSRCPSPGPRRPPTALTSSPALGGL